jgi:chemotaxis signal transduction protein
LEKNSMDEKKLYQYLCVKIGGRWLGVDATQIVEIINPASSVGAGLKFTDNGKTINYRGKILPTIRLADILLGSATHYHTAQRVLISETSEKMAGLIVDSAEEIIRIPEDKLSLVDPAHSEMNGESLEGVIETEEKLISILSLDKLYVLAGVV